MSGEVRGGKRIHELPFLNTADLDVILPGSLNGITYGLKLGLIKALVNNLTLNWTNIIDRPLSYPNDIDIAVNKRHSHANTSILDELSEINGFLAYKNEIIATVDTPQW